ncbi:MAG: hypothetical protein ACFB01_02535 [Cohaesibacteraceae bacterium]
MRTTEAGIWTLGTWACGLEKVADLFASLVAARTVNSPSLFIPPGALAGPPGRCPIAET